VDENELGSLFLVVATVKKGVDPAAVEKEMDAIINETIDKGVTAEEVKRFQNRYLAGFLRGSETLGGFGGRSDILAESQTYGGSPEAYLDRLEVFAKATPDEVKAAGAKWLKNNHYTMLVKPMPNYAAEKTAVDRKVVPAIGSAPVIKFPDIQRAKLKNGLNVILLERHSAPIVNVTLAVDAGSSSDTTQKAGAATLALDLMDEGTKTRNSFRIVDELDALGSELNTGSSLDMSIVRLNSTTANLKPSLPIMADVVLNPSFPADKFDIQKQLRLAQIGQEMANPNAAVQRVVPGILYGADHAYGKPLSGFTATVQGITRDDLMKWHADWFKPGSATVIVTGDVTLAEIVPLLEGSLGSWKSGTAPKKNLGTVPRSPGKKIYLIDKPDAAQSTIMAAHISEMSGQPEDLASEPLFRNFGGMSTSRLNRNLRLDKHWSYGAGGGLQGGRGQRPFIVIAPVQTDKTKESMIEVIKEIRDIAGGRPVTGEEFQSIMRNMTLRLPGRFETLASLEGAALNLVNYGLPDNYWAGYGASVSSLTEAQLAEAGKKFVRPDEIVWIIVGDLNKVEKGIRELGFGEVVRIDAEGAIIK
jgi:zinc protease